MDENSNRAHEPAVSDERELWACANEMIRLHGDEAHAEAAARVNQLTLVGDYEGAAVWQLILHRIRELQKAPDGPAH